MPRRQPIPFLDKVYLYFSIIYIEEAGGVEQSEIGIRRKRGKK